MSRRFARRVSSLFCQLRHLRYTLISVRRGEAGAYVFGGVATALSGFVGLLS